MAALPFTVIGLTGIVIAQFAAGQDATDYVQEQNRGTRKCYQVIDTHRVADFRRGVKLRENTRPVHEVRV